MGLHNDIMNLRCEVPKDANVNQALSFKYGHKQARHAAAELANTAEAEFELLRDENKELRSRVAELEAAQAQKYEYQDGYDGKVWAACSKAQYDRFMAQPDLFGKGGYMVRRVAVC